MSNKDLAKLILVQFVNACDLEPHADPVEVGVRVISDLLNQHRPVRAASQDTTAAKLVDITRTASGFTNIENPNLNPGHNA